MNHYQARLEKIGDWMAEEGISLVMFEDTEGRRDASIRWLTGHPGDALLFLAVEPAAEPRNGDASTVSVSPVCKSLLMPWDIILAKAYSRADFIIPYNEFDRMPRKAIRGAVEKLKIPFGSKIEIPPVTPYPVFLDYVGELSDFDIICRDRSAASHALDMRTIKDAEELALIRKAADVTNAIIGLLEKNVRSGKIKTEADAALFIELESRKRGCEGTSFETLAAGHDRSFGIHAFPSWTSAPFAGEGLSILDFGLRLGGYCSDVTLTFVRDPDTQQQKMVNLVEKAAKLATEMAVNGNETRALAAAVDALFSKSKKRMPHGLGHGLGLDVHEYPFIRNRSDYNWKLEPGMVFTLEPGLYDPVHGGCRLENDILMTETGREILTEARIIWL
jgi:Xaa-Pro dipeptidase